MAKHSNIVFSIQLEAVIKSDVAKKYGLGVSLLERLMKTCPLYNGSRADPRFMTMLVRNFRSHADLLAIPSRLFYHNKLVPCADQVGKSNLFLFVLVHFICVVQVCIQNGHFVPSLSALFFAYLWTTGSHNVATP